MTYSQAYRPGAPFDGVFDFSGGILRCFQVRREGGREGRREGRREGEKVGGEREVRGSAYLINILFFSSFLCA